MTFFNTVYKNCSILMEIEPRILEKLKILQPYPPLLAVSDDVGQRRRACGIMYLARK